MLFQTDTNLSTPFWHAYVTLTEHTPQQVQRTLQITSSHLPWRKQARTVTLDVKGEERGMTRRLGEGDQKSECKEERKKNQEKTSRKLMDGILLHLDFAHKLIDEWWCVWLNTSVAFVHVYFGLHFSVCSLKMIRCVCVCVCLWNFKKKKIPYCCCWSC